MDDDGWMCDGHITAVAQARPGTLTLATDNVVQLSNQPCPIVFSCPHEAFIHVRDGPPCFPVR
eukprot:11080402-Karenia_brevis.AAC.1